MKKHRAIPVCIIYLPHVPISWLESQVNHWFCAQLSSCNRLGYHNYSYPLPFLAQSVQYLGEMQTSSLLQISPHVEISIAAKLRVAS